MPFIPRAVVGPGIGLEKNIPINSVTFQLAKACLPEGVWQAKLPRTAYFTAVRSFAALAKGKLIDEFSRFLRLI
jgi:hypothetical protein